MKYTDIFTLIKSLNFPPDKYVVIGGAAMAGRKIKETTDIDILVSQDLLEELKKKPEWHYHPRIIPTEPSGLVNNEGTVELYPTIGGTNKGFEEVRKDSEMIQGIPFATLSHVVEIKKIYSRNKDLKDIEIIKKYLSGLAIN
ncbi:MAG: hypothetical protein JWN37_885 [Candidatus Nomurabacteria bacterium]|nr:hypothetical protein [Candidatus Nomurabacteria bacterium]